MKTVAIIQARLSSTRLPGKVLKDICGETMLARVVHRTQRATLLDEMVVATTTLSSDDVIVIECERLGIPVFRGSELDVLDRYYRAAKKYQAEVVVRITADCPLLAPEIIDQVVGIFREKDSLDFVSNRLPPRTFPRGQEVDVMSSNALERAWRKDDNPTWREHVTPYIYNHPEKFKIVTVTNAEDYSWMRWTVDTAADLDFVRCIYEHFGKNNVSWHEIIAWLEDHPEVTEINQHVVQKELGV